MTALTLRNIHKHYDKSTIIENLSLEIASGEFIVLVGPSGCGKSTLLRIIAGLESADGGTLLMGDEEVTHQPAGRRSLSMVFQSYALYPHMTVRQNLSFGLKNMKTPPAEIAQRIDGAAKMLRLEALLDRSRKTAFTGPNSLNSFEKTMEYATPEEMFDSRKLSAIKPRPKVMRFSPAANSSALRKTIGMYHSRKRSTLSIEVQNSSSCITLNRLLSPVKTGVPLNCHCVTLNSASQASG